MSSLAETMTDRLDEEALETGDHDDKKMCQREEWLLLFGGFSVLKSPTWTKQQYCKCCQAKVVAGRGNTSSLLHHLN